MKCVNKIQIGNIFVNKLKLNIMKYRYLLAFVFALASFLPGCRKPDELIMTEKKIKAPISLVGSILGSDIKYSAKVDEEAGTIKVRVPYYISDTEPIQGDLSQMRVEATLPVGARFIPSIAGIHDLVSGFHATLVRADGTKKDYLITAEYFKSPIALITKVTLPDAPSAFISYAEPANKEKGAVNILKTSRSIEIASQHAKIEVSPWARWESDAKNADGTVDLSGSPEIKVIAQDGTTVIYKSGFEYPKFVKKGTAGYMSHLFHLFPSKKESFGFIQGNNRTCAVVGNYLVISALDFNFLVFDRFDGKKLSNVKVNVDGCLTGTAQVHAITTDSEGHLVAMTLAAANDQLIKNKIFEIYVWKDGIENPPVKILSGDITSDAIFESFRNSNKDAVGKTWDVGRKIGICGDVTKGDAVIATLSPGMARIMRIIVKDGKVKEITGSAWGLTMWNQQTTIVPLDTRPTGAFLHNGSTNRLIGYTSQADKVGTILMQPGPKWWNGWVIGIRYIEFNGMKLIGVANTMKENGAFHYTKMIISDISNPNVNTFKGGDILDTREDNYDYNNGREIGKGKYNFTTGFVSFYNSNWSIGPDNTQTGDVAFGMSPDGNAVQAYLMVTDHGVLAYEITRYDM